MTPEGQIKKLILDWLNAQPGCYVRSIQIGNIGGRVNSSKGVSDIIGAWKGWALAIEVKALKGKVTPEQESFLRCWSTRGKGISIIARSLEDVERALNGIKERTITQEPIQQKGNQI